MLAWLPVVLGANSTSPWSAEREWYMVSRMDLAVSSIIFSPATIVSTISDWCLTKNLAMTMTTMATKTGVRDPALPEPEPQATRSDLTWVL